LNRAIRENRVKVHPVGLFQFHTIFKQIIYLCHKCEWAYSELWIPDKDERFMVNIDTWATSDRKLGKISQLSPYFKFAKGIGLIGKVWDSSDIIIIEDIRKDKSFLRTEVASIGGLFSAVGVPIIQNSQVRAIIAFLLTSYIEKDQEVFNSIKNQFSESF